MKGLRLFFAVFLAPLTFFGAVADDMSDISRAATSRQDATSAVSVTRGKSSGAPTKSVSRGTDISRQSVTSRERTADLVTRSYSDNAIKNDTRTTTTPIRNVASRSATLPRTTTQTTTPTRAQTVARTALTPTRAPIARTANKTTGAFTRTSSTPARSGTLSRAADLSKSQILTRNFSKCRDVFYDCMDEFCANKDSQLKRCACSSRANEFANAQRELNKVEEKLLDFSQRLLTVNMNAEDAVAMNQATEGELAFNKKDTSQSKKLLDDIAKKLNTSFDDSNFDQNLNAISLSLNTDMAFDSIDSMMGASTTTKSGPELYNAALPVCREMAAEVCTSDELSIAESGYQMTIEQDCNTVAKSYQNLTDQARAKVYESSALLDMSRLDIYQQRNSDDILTCKKKMLAMLTDTTVCGENLGQCLDISGQYIDPTTGTAFLTTNLVNLSTLITRPDGNQTWTTAPGNDRFVQYLNSKKKFLEPAMEKCQDIADTVWDLFVEDALSQIKLAQESKLEDVRQSCTTLLSECLDDANDSISEFDSRALSIFGVSADMTVNTMCSNVRASCTALLDSVGGQEWSTGVSDITTNITYEKILTTCREIGRQCIIQTCTSISGNFGLCENIDTSINRKSIISRRACWNEVVNCVASAGASSLDAIMTQQGRNATTSTGHIYTTIYTTNAIPSYNAATSQIYDLCTECGTGNNPDCNTCRLAEQIWGNCEYAPDEEGENQIYVNQGDNETLLSWFARNTGTEDNPDSCRDTTCPLDTKANDNGICAPLSDFTSEGAYCPVSEKQIHITKTFTNCCQNGFDGVNYCCNEYRHNGRIKYPYGGTNTDGHALCLPDDSFEPFAKYTYDKTTDNGTTTVTGYLICDGTIKAGEKTDKYPNGQHVLCDTSNGGYGWIHIVPSDGGYKKPTTYKYYKNENGNVCELTNYTNGTWENCSNSTDGCIFQGSATSTEKNLINGLNQPYRMTLSYKAPCPTTTSEQNE